MVEASGAAGAFVCGGSIEGAAVGATLPSFPRLLTSHPNRDAEPSRI